MNRSSDWLEEIYFGRILVGVLLGSLLPAILALLFASPTLANNWLFLVLITYFSIMVGTVFAAWPCSSILGRVATGFIVALGCSAISFIVSVATDPINGAALGGVVFMFIGFTIIGLSSGLALGVFKS